MAIMDSNSPKQRDCPDCNKAMAEIRLIDKSDYGIHTDMEYALAESKRSWTSYFPLGGKVTAFMCGECGRIVLYGVPKGSQKTA